MWERLAEGGTVLMPLDKYLFSERYDSEQGTIARYPGGMEPDREGALMFGDFRILGQWFAAMDSAHEHGFTFNEAVSFMVNCENQAEQDAYWEKLSAVPEAGRCGWLKDRFGVSWQITPRELDTMMRDGSREQVDRVTQAFLPMRKLELDVMRRAYRGE